MSKDLPNSPITTVQLNIPQLIIVQNCIYNYLKHDLNRMTISVRSNSIRAKINDKNL